MSELTPVECISRVLKRQPVDHIGLSEGFWGDTQKKWADGGRTSSGYSSGSDGSPSSNK